MPETGEGYVEMAKLALKVIEMCFVIMYILVESSAIVADKHKSLNSVFLHVFSFPHRHNIAVKIRSGIM